MKRVVLPAPPDPMASQFAGSPLLWQRMAYQWMQQTKQLLDDANRVNGSPMGQAFVVGSFTTNTTISGSSTGTDVSNFVSSLVTAMQAKGLTSPSVNRGNT